MSLLWLSVMGCMIACVLSLIFTPLVRKLSHRIGAVSVPNHRSVHKSPMPRLGGLAIFLSFSIAFFLSVPVMGADKNVFIGLFIGGMIMETVGVLDDKYTLSAKAKLFGQFLSALVVVLFGLQIDYLTLPFTGTGLHLDWWISVPLTLFWILAVTNAVNLIDGLDGLAAGVSAIACISMLVMAMMMNNAPIVVLSAILLGSLIGFLRYNFLPASIFMGDSGALFLGYVLATLSIFGYKQVTFVSFIIPVLILGVPLSDTLLTIIRRKLHKVPVFKADMGHLHHSLIRFGFSQRQTILIMYGMAILFGLCAVLMSREILWLTVAVIVVVMFLFAAGAELVGIFNKNNKIFLKFLHKLVSKTIRARQ